MGTFVRVVGARLLGVALATALGAFVLAPSSAAAPPVIYDPCAIYTCYALTVQAGDYYADDAYQDNGSGSVTTADGSISCSLTADVASGACSHEYLSGSDVTLTATAATGSKALQTSTGLVDSWAFTAHVTADAVLMFEFSLTKVPLAVTESGAGTGRVTSSPAGIDCGATCTASFDYGTSVTLTATPDAGAAFRSWTGACAGQGATCTLSITAATSTNVAFGLPPASPSPSPTPTPSPSSGVGPTAGAPLVRFPSTGVAGPAKMPVRVAWTGSQRDAPIVAYGLQRRTGTGPWTDVALAASLATAVVTNLPLGGSQQFRARAADAAGRTGAWTSGAIFALAAYQESSKAITYSGSWSGHAVSSAWAGTTKDASHSGASATFRFSGFAVAFVAPRGPSEGSARIYVDGVLVKTISLYATSARARQLVFATGWPSVGSHRITVKVIGTRGHPTVGVDAFVVLH